MKRKRKDPTTIRNLTLEQRTAFAELLAFKDQDVLKEMLSLVYDAAIKAQFDQHIGAEPHERSSQRRDLRNRGRARGLNTRAGSLDLEIPRARNSNFQPTVDEQNAEIKVILHWIGGRHSRLTFAKNRTGHNRHMTCADAEQVVTSMASRFNDEVIAATLNKLRLRTGHGPYMDGEPGTQSAKRSKTPNSMLLSTITPVSRCVMQRFGWGELDRCATHDRRRLATCKASCCIRSVADRCRCTERCTRPGGFSRDQGRKASCTNSK